MNVVTPGICREFVVLLNMISILTIDSYWNWSYDWHNLTASPLFDNEYGFGGDGNRSDVKSWRGYCVTTGPFAHHQVPYEYTEVVPHCLSRHFADEETLATLNSGVTPESVEELLSADTFAHFSNMLESQHIHLTIVKFILGDFASRGAAGGKFYLSTFKIVEEERLKLIFSMNRSVVVYPSFPD